MAKKKAANDDYILFDVLYEDGSRSSNRRLPADKLDAHNIDASARALIEAQDREIAEMAGRFRGAVKSVTRSGSRR